MPREIDILLFCVAPIARGAAGKPESRHHRVVRSPIIVKVFVAGSWWRNDRVVVIMEGPMIQWFRLSLCE